jgi:hypothetical protein
MATKIEHLLTVIDLEAMPEDGNRYEIIEGELFVSCAPGLTHQQVSTNIVVYMADRPARSGDRDPLSRDREYEARPRGQAPTLWQTWRGGVLDG